MGRGAGLRLRTLLAVAIMVGAAGCVASDPGPRDASVPPSTPAPPPTVTAETGSVTGTIVDPEQRPVGKAVIAVVEAALETNADPTGAFTFNEVPPGAYRLVASALGYESAGRRIDVVAGEVTEVSLVLQPLQIAPAGFVHTIKKTGYILFGQWTVQYTQHLANVTGANMLCDPCAFNLHLYGNITGAMTEVDFTPSVSAPVVNHQVGIGIIKDHVEGASNSYMSISYYAPRGQRVWGDTEVKNLKGDNLIRLQIHGPGPNAPGIAFQQRVDTYSSFAIYETFLEGFSALPPQ